MSARVCAVIPYFQREPGILRRALEAAFAQVHVPPPRIVIVDDSSPVPAEDEVGTLPEAHRAHVTVMRQPNGGPAAARNRGLDAVPAGIEYVAFLDSDDQWLPQHLARACTTLDAGFDFYFANYFDVDSTVDGFTERGILGTARAHPLATFADTYAYREDLMLQILDQGAIETSTVVFRRATLGDLRFRVDFRDAYEDLMFWLDVAQRTQRIAFSTQPEVQYGRGINLFRSGTWGTDASMKRVVASTRFRSHARRHRPLNAAQRAVVDARLAVNRRDFVSELLHRLRARKPMLWPHVRHMFRADPVALLTVLPEALRQVARRAGSKKRGA
jgi:succinoglycan biosynthesis protein ExoW